MMLIYILLCVICVILITLVLMQDSKSGLGGLTGGTTMSAFGANTDKALIKATGIIGAIFFLLVITIHLIKKGEPQTGSLMPLATESAKVTVPPVSLGTKEKEPAKGDAAETKPTSVSIPLKDIKDSTTPLKADLKDTPVTPAEPEKK